MLKNFNRCLGNSHRSLVVSVLSITAARPLADAGPLWLGAPPTVEGSMEESTPTPFTALVDSWEVDCGAARVVT